MGIVVAWLAIFLTVVWGQTSDVQQCIPSYNWTINNHDQTPCLVAAYLESGCGIPASVDAIPEGTHYVGPTVAIANACYCNTVTYSIMSACAGCQDRSYLNWTTWSYNCSVTYESVFPGTILSGTSVPSWAYLDLSETNDTFDPVVAAQNLSITLPSSVFPTTTVASTTTISYIMSGSATPSTTNPSSKSSSPNIGVIVGGALGGSVAVAIILLAILVWFLKRRSNWTQRDLVFDRTALVSRQTASGTSTPFGQNHLGSNYTTMQSMNASSPQFTSSPSLASSPHSASRRSLEGPSPSIVYFGTSLQPNRHAGFRTGIDQSHIQI